MIFAGRRTGWMTSGCAPDASAGRHKLPATDTGGPMNDSPAEEFGVPIFIDTAESLEEMGQVIKDRFVEIYERGGRVLSVSHGVDRENPDGRPYSTVIVGAPRTRVEVQVGGSAAS